MALVNGRNELTERKLLPGHSRKVLVGGSHQKHRCGMAAQTERVLPLQVREAPRESSALGLGDCCGKEACTGKGAARSLHHGGLGRQRWGSSAVGGVRVRVLMMVLEAGAVLE